MSKDYNQLQESFEMVMDRLHPENFEKQYKKESRKRLFHEFAPVLHSWILDCAHRQRETFNELLKRLSTPKVAKTLASLIEDYNSNEYFDEEDKIGIEFVIVINEILNKLDPKDELYSDFYAIAEDLITPRAKKMVKQTGVNITVAKNLLLVLPKPTIITRTQQVGVFTNKIVRRLYSFAFSNHEGLPVTTSQLKDIFKYLFGKHYMDEVVLGLALERRNTNNSNNEKFKQFNSLLTTFVVDYIEGMKKDKVKDILLSFADRRLKDREQKRDQSRRLQVNTLSPSDYPKINKARKKLLNDKRLQQVL